MKTVRKSVSSFQAAISGKLEHTLERQGNSLQKGMGGTLAIRCLSTLLKGMGVNCPLSGPTGLKSSLEGEELIHTYPNLSKPTYQTLSHPLKTYQNISLGAFVTYITYIYYIIY